MKCLAPPCISSFCRVVERKTKQREKKQDNWTEPEPELGPFDGFWSRLLSFIFPAPRRTEEHCSGRPFEHFRGLWNPCRLSVGVCCTLVSPINPKIRAPQKACSQRSRCSVPASYPVVGSAPRTLPSLPDFPHVIGLGATTDKRTTTQNRELCIHTLPIWGCWLGWARRVCRWAPCLPFVLISFLLFLSHFCEHQTSGTVSLASPWCTRLLERCWQLFLT